MEDTTQLEQQIAATLVKCEKQIVAKARAQQRAEAKRYQKTLERQAQAKAELMATNPAVAEMIHQAEANGYKVTVDNARNVPKVVRDLFKTK